MGKRLPVGRLKAALVKMLETEDQPPSEVSVLITTADEVRSLNRRYRGEDAPTDVLSFPTSGETDPDGVRVLGDVVIAWEVCCDQAKKRCTTVETEMACLAVHGGLHLIGYEDDNERGRREMTAKMNTIVASIGIDPPKNWSSLEH